VSSSNVTGPKRRVRGEITCREWRSRAGASHLYILPFSPKLAALSSSCQPGRPAPLALSFHHRDAIGRTVFLSVLAVCTETVRGTSILQGAIILIIISPEQSGLCWHLALVRLAAARRPAGHTPSHPPGEGDYLVVACGFGLMQSFI
jgi:hypothetical protein